MSDSARLLAAVWFLPLFPFSALFVNLLGRKVRSAAVRSVLFVIWPTIGVVLLGASLPGWLQIWALLSALLYALRMMSTRDLKLWSAYLGASAYALLWLASGTHGPGLLTALVLGVPLAIVAQLGGALEKRFGAAYSGLYGGLHLRQPRLAGLLTLTLLASVATPIFPGFFVLTGIVFHAGPGYAVGTLLVWLLWTWAAVLLQQGFMLGKTQTAPSPPDLQAGQLNGLAAALAVLVVVGLFAVTTLLLGG